MQKILKHIAFLLCVSLLISCAGCFQPGDDPETTGSTPTQTMSPSTPSSPGNTDPSAPAETEPGLVDTYRAAMNALLAKNALSMTISSSKVMELGHEVITSSSNQEVTFIGIGTGDVRCNVEETANFNGYETDITELFVGGKLYSTVYDSDFTCEMTVDEFTARYVPIMAIEADLYASCTLETADGGMVIQFRDAIQPESWLGADEAQWVSGEADVYLDENNQISGIHYTAVYRYAGANVVSDFTVDYKEPTLTTIEAPTDVSDYITLSDPNAPRLLEQVCGYLYGYDSISFNSQITTYVEAAALYMSQSSTIHSYGSGKDINTRAESSAYIMDGYNQQTHEYDLDELFINGKYTISTDGGKPEPNRAVTAEVIENYILNQVTEYVLDWAYFSDVTCTDLGSLLLYEFTGDEELAKIIDSEVCYDVFNDENLLSDMASNYKAEPVEYYVAVDKYLGLPTAIGLYYKGTYTIDGYKYASTRQVDQSIYLASLDTYQAIHEVSAPDTKPEEPAKPLFYHVTGPDGQEMWLLGTIHVGDDRTGYLPQEIYDAYTAADALAVECNTRAFDDQAERDEELQEALSKVYYYSNNSTAEDHISDKELYEYAVQMMKATGNYFYNAPYLRVAAWAGSIENFFLRLSYSLSSDKGVDNRLLMMAEADGKTILEVESSLFQIQMLNGWSDALSEELLLSAVSTDALEYSKQLQELYDMWCAGDEAALIAYLNEDPGDMTEEEKKLYEEYNNAMSLDRDKGMVKTAIEYLESGDTVFYAVGLAHLLSEAGLVNSLREAGYTVELVEYK